MNHRKPTNFSIQLGKTWWKRLMLFLLSDRSADVKVRSKWEGMHWWWEGNPEGGKDLLPVCNPSNVRVSQDRVSQFQQGFPEMSSCLGHRHMPDTLQETDIFLHFLIYISQIVPWEPEKASCHGNKKYSIPVKKELSWKASFLCKWQMVLGCRGWGESSIKATSLAEFHVLIMQMHLDITT